MFVVVDAPFAGFPNMLPLLAVVESLADAPNEKADAPAGFAPKGLADDVPLALPVGAVGELPSKLNEKAGFSGFSAVAPGVVGVRALPPEPNPNKGFGTSAGFELALPNIDWETAPNLEAPPKTLLPGAGGGLDRLAAELLPPPKLKENFGAVVESVDAEFDELPVAGTVGVELGVIELAAGEKPKPDLGVAPAAGVVEPPKEVDGKEIFGAAGTVGVDDGDSPDGVPKLNDGAGILAGSCSIDVAAGVVAAAFGFENPNENVGTVVSTGVPAGVVEAAFAGSVAGV